jgi:hypothetical protein
MYQVVSCWPLAAEAWVQPGSAHVGFMVEMVTLGQTFSLSSLVFPCQCHSTRAPYLYIIWGTKNRHTGGRVQRLTLDRLPGMSRT